MGHTEETETVFVALVVTEDGASVAAVSRDPSDAKDQAQDAADPEGRVAWRWTDGPFGDVGYDDSDPTGTTLLVQEAKVR